MLYFALRLHCFAHYSVALIFLKAVLLMILIY